MDCRRALTNGFAAGLLALTIACGSPAGGPSPTPGGATPTATPSLDPPTPPLTTITNQSWGWISPNPDNPRYLRASGQPFAISSYGSLVGCSFTADQARRLKQQGASYVVVWHQWSGCGNPPDWMAVTWTGPWRLACDPRDPAQRDRCPSHPLWDLSQFDDNYWQRLDAMLAAAEDAGDGTGKRLVARVHLFARQEFGTGRESNPFRGGNNVNGVRAFDAGGSRDPDLRYFTRAAASCALNACDEPAKSLFAFQQAYVRKLLDATYSHGNVVYELMNEPVVAEDPGSEYAFFAQYWSWFVKDYLASHYGVARLVAQDETDFAYGMANVDVVHADGAGSGQSITSEAQFVGEALPSLAAVMRARSLSQPKVSDLDEFANGETDASRLRRQAWTIVASGGHFHFEDPCDPGARACPWGPGDSLLDAQPWVPVRSIEAFKAASGWRFDRAHPLDSDTPSTSRWFYWMVQDGPPDSVGFAAAGAQDHVGYLAHHEPRACAGEPLSSELPKLPDGAAGYVARLWNPAGTDYLKDGAGNPLEYRFLWSGGALDWCQTPLKDAILAAPDVVIHVHAGR